MKKLASLGLVAVVAAALTATALPAAAATTATAPAPAASTSAQYPENVNLTPEQIRARTVELNQRYTVVGTELSAPDAEFVKMYAQQTQSSSADSESQAQTMAVHEMTFNNRGSGANASGGINGRMALDNGEFSTNNSYAGFIFASGTSNVTQVTACFNVRAYGTAGQGGVGLVYSDDPCQTNSSSNISMTVNKRYSAFVVYSTMTANATFRSSSGTFQVSS